MIKRKFGWTKIDVSIIGQGTWLIDQPKDNRDNNKKQNIIKTIRFGLDSGITHIDTAEMYGNGR